MHPLIACLCNSRIVQPAHAGDAPSWPLLLLWGGLLAAAAVGAAVWLVRRRRSAVGSATDERWRLTGTFVDGPDAESDPPRDAEHAVAAPEQEAETIQRR